MTTQFSTRVTPVMQRIIDALERDGDMDAFDLAEAACTCHNSLSGGGYLRKLLERGLIRVASWRRNNPGAPTPIYSVTPGAPAKKPPVYSRSTRTKRWKQKSGYGTPSYEHRQALKALINITRSKA